MLYFIVGMATAATMPWIAGTNGTPDAAQASLASSALVDDAGETGQKADIIIATALSRTLRKRAQRRHTLKCLKAALVALKSFTKIAFKAS